MSMLPDMTASALTLYERATYMNDDKNLTLKNV